MIHADTNTSYPCLGRSFCVLTARKDCLYVQFTKFRTARHRQAWASFKSESGTAFSQPLGQISARCPRLNGCYDRQRQRDSMPWAGSVSLIGSHIEISMMTRLNKPNICGWSHFLNRCFAALLLSLALPEGLTAEPCFVQVAVAMLRCNAKWRISRLDLSALVVR